MSIEIILADDHKIVRDGLKSVIQNSGEDIKVIGEASNGRDVLKLAEKKCADIYVLDISMPLMNGIETAKRLMKLNPNNKVIMLTMYDNMDFVKESLDCGAKGYILKENATDEVVRALCEVQKGGCFLSPQVAKYVIMGFTGKIKDGQSAKYKKLTPREREILQLIAEGFSSKEVAFKLKVSFNTVLVHRNNIMKKLKVHKQTELVRYALKEGIAKL